MMTAFAAIVIQQDINGIALDLREAQAIEKDDTSNDDLKEKLQTYQNLKEQYLNKKQELKDEGFRTEKFN